jgi:hypothetical protein
VYCTKYHLSTLRRKLLRNFLLRYVRISSQNSVRKNIFEGTFFFSNCHIIGLDTGSLVLIVFDKNQLAGNLNSHTFSAKPSKSARMLYFSRLVFSSIDVCLRDLACHFKTDPSETVVFCFGIHENTYMALIYMTLYQFSNDMTISYNRPIPVHLNDMATTNDMFSS